MVNLKSYFLVVIQMTTLKQDIPTVSWVYSHRLGNINLNVSGCYKKEFLFRGDISAPRSISSAMSTGTAKKAS